jgi:hypothetical protein
MTKEQLSMKIMAAVDQVVGNGPLMSGQKIRLRYGLLEKIWPALENPDEHTDIEVGQFVKYTSAHDSYWAYGRVEKIIPDRGFIIDIGEHFVLAPRHQLSVAL